jgi:hypothetical protein
MLHQDSEGRKQYKLAKSPPPPKMTKKQVDAFETLQAQLKGLYEEMQTLVKKSPNDSVNKFKLGLVNGIVRSANEFLGDEQRPIKNFTQFEEADLPSNSDVLMILSQYLSCLEKIRADNIGHNYNGWQWMIDGQLSGIRTAPPKKLVN